MGYAQPTSERLYFKFIEIEDKDALKDALSDWRADGVTESDHEFTLRIKKWLKQNERMRDEGVEEEDDMDVSKVMNRDCWWTEGIYLRSDDTCIGFTRGKFSGNCYYHYVTAIRPSYRGSGYFGECNLMGNKILFTTYTHIEKQIAMIPDDQLNKENSYASLDALGTDDEKETRTDRIAPTTYQKKIITRDQFMEWYNKDEQKPLRDAYYNYEIIN
tara:strand:+ start:1352 stop:1999 length:648 start_codon:yes stop_codon:yes gene_type:complete